MTLAFDLGVFIDGSPLDSDVHRGVVTAVDVPAAVPAANAAPESFRRAFRSHPAGVAVATANVGGQLVGVTVSSLISLSAEPPVVAFSVSNSSVSGAAIGSAETLVIHLMGPDQLATSRIFSTPGVDRFSDDVRWSLLPTGEPALEDAVVRLRGAISRRVDTGAATLLIVSVEDIDFVAEADQPGARALVYHNRGWFCLDDTMELPA